ncbi:unnamed protein product [Spirodela intermedia]|uniref:Uncharacterized protein n=1 Tax=Spirodela intermedia TaxID=51605 RepID=A0A7I8IC87_SPIIN|nr:unnamed protein product [Spirodela intermedia]CAA6655249.1 unnamed protein product [Spirodela intermedia]
MGLVRTPSMRSGDLLEGMINEYVVGKGSKMRLSKGTPSRIVAALTCLQFAFAMYATFLLYYMSPSVDLRPKPEFSWATNIVQHWKQMVLPGFQGTAAVLTPEEACEHEQIDFVQKKSDDAVMIGFKRYLYDEVLDFQRRTLGSETLAELMAMKSKWKRGGPDVPKITVILNHFKRKTLCSQLDSLLHQTVPFHNLSLRKIVESYNNSKISFVSSSYDFKYYGRFQMALQSEADFIYILDDDMIPGRRMLEILSHAGGTDKYRNSVLGSIGRILPFRQKDFSFPSYRKFRSKEAGLYLPDPAYDITVDRVVQVDFLSSSWFLSADLVKTLFVETPFTWMTGEDLHLRRGWLFFVVAQLPASEVQGRGSFVLPVDPSDKETWGDSEHRLAYVSETTVIFKDIVQVRDDQWWRALSTGYITQWAAMNPQKIDALFYAHSIDEVRALAPLLEKFRTTVGKKAYIADAAVVLKWPRGVCKERRFKIFDLGAGAISGISNSEGLLKIHNPSLLITVDDLDPSVRSALKTAAEGSENGTIFVALPRTAVPKALWMADLRSTALANWNKMRISVNIITQNRVNSLQRLLRSLDGAFYLGDEIPVSFNMDSMVDEATLNLVGSFNWTRGPKLIRRRVIQGGLIRAVSESWYPSSDDDFGVLLEDDIEVSPYYYMWIKYALLAYHYDPQVSLRSSPPSPSTRRGSSRCSSGTSTPTCRTCTNSLQLGCRLLPKQWREFYAYMNSRFTDDAKENPVQIPKSRTNGWQASWKKFLIDMMYLRGYVSLFPNFPNQASFSTNHMEPGAHISAKDNVVKHNKDDFEVPLLGDDFTRLLPGGSCRRPPSSPCSTCSTSPCPSRRSSPRAPNSARTSSPAAPPRSSKQTARPACPRTAPPSSLGLLPPTAMICSHTAFSYVY